MEGPRAPQEAELAGLLRFLDDSLRAGQTWSIASEYPTVFGKSNLHNLRVITDQDRVLSHAALKPLIVKTPLLIYKAGAIGSVVTAQDRQGQGLSTQILEACLSEAKAQDCDFAILWTNLYDFYRRRGFELAGFEESVVLESEFEAPLKDLKFLEGAKVAPDAILRLYTQHSIGSARNLEDVRKFLQIPNSKVHTAWDSKGQLVAYAIEGKGADLTDYIHEWGGGVPQLLSLLSHLRKSKGRPFTMILPNHSVNLLLQLQTRPVTITQGYLGMIKLLNHENFFSKIHRAAKSLAIPDLVLEKSGDKFRVGIGQDVRETLDDKELVQLFFGPESRLAFMPATEEKMNRLFPLPLWFWGWDSI